MRGRLPTGRRRGWPGYARLVLILTDPAHEEQQDMLDRLGLGSRSHLDPARFEPDEANRRLAAVDHTEHVVPGIDRGDSRFSRCCGSWSRWVLAATSGCGTPFRCSGYPTWRTGVVGDPWSN